MHSGETEEVTVTQLGPPSSKRTPSPADPKPRASLCHPSRTPSSAPGAPLDVKRLQMEPNFSLQETARDPSAGLGLRGQGAGQPPSCSPGPCPSSGVSGWQLPPTPSQTLKCLSPTLCLLSGAR